jgi:predicted dienelactone hydrolase
MLKEWPAHDRIDSARIGIFGHSLGGFTALIAIGGTPDLAEIPRFCAARPDAPECQFVRQTHGDQLSLAGAPIEWRADPRTRAAVIAAPAVVFPVDKGRLRAVDVPVQLWRVIDDQQAPDAWNSRIVREGLPRKPEEHVVRNAGHMAFRPCSDGLAKVAPFVCQDPPGFDRGAFHQEFNRAVVAFFSKCLARQ